MTTGIDVEVCPHHVLRSKVEDRWSAIDRLVETGKMDTATTPLCFCFCCGGPAQAVFRVVLNGPDEHPVHVGTDVMCMTCTKGAA